MRSYKLRTLQVGVTTIAYEELINHEDPEVGRKWQLSSANEFGRTIQGVGNTRVEEDKVKGTATMHLIKKCDIPRNKKITYARFYSEYQTTKS